MRTSNHLRGWAAAGLAVLALAGSGATRAEDGFTRLYNGRDLTGWHVERGKLEAWKANGEMISCVTRGGGYLATDREYGDFIFRLEYRLPPAGNSGIGLRFAPGTWPSTQAMELQLLDDAHPKYANLGPLHRNGSIYTHVAARTNPSKPAGQWNRLVIRCQGPLVEVQLNGVEIQKANLDDYGDSVGKGTIPLARRPRKGLVGLQSHGDPVDFRNLEIREL